VAHELKTPLNGVKGFADLLASGARGPMTPEQAACVTEIRGGVQHMRTMIGDLLDLARIEAGTIDLKPEDVTLAGLLAEALVVARPMAEGHKVALTAAGELSTEIHVDFGRTKQVLINLLSNAIKFSPEGAMVSVTGMASSGEVRITVSDAGPGISEEDQKKLFSEFGQVGAAGNPDGTGLGLAISRRLVELQGGRIWVESEPVRGTRFHVAFPAARGEAVDGVALVPATGVR
jgi:signal transduction histidine kinase